MRTDVCKCVMLRGAWNAAPLGRFAAMGADGRICALDSICAFRRVGMSPVCVIAVLCHCGFTVWIVVLVLVWICSTGFCGVELLWQPFSD